MASLYLLPLFIFLLLPSSLSYLLHVTKHDPTGQYLTQAHLVLDLSGPFIWADCTTNKPTTLTRHSIQCSAANAALPFTGADPSPCTLPVTNPFTGETAAAELVQETVGPVDELMILCAPSILLKGLASGSHGVIGFGKTRIAAPEQISHSFGSPKRFSLCLSNSQGMVVVDGQGFDSGISKSLIYTPLLNKEEDYAINLKGIRIQNKKLSLGLESQMGKIKLSTVSPFSSMESGIYQIFVRAFTIAAKSLNLTSVPPVAPFGSCFALSNSIPVIDLVLQSEMVKWRINGHNSMVKVGDDVMCLGFLNGGEDLGASIVLAGYQLEDNLLEIDLGSSMLGFSSSLIMKKTSCSKLTSSMQKSVQSM